MSRRKQPKPRSLKRDYTDCDDAVTASLMGDDTPDAVSSSVAAAAAAADADRREALGILLAAETSSADAGVPNNDICPSLRDDNKTTVEAQDAGSVSRARMDPRVERDIGQLEEMDSDDTERSRDITVKMEREELAKRRCPSDPGPWMAKRSCSSPRSSLPSPLPAGRCADDNVIPLPVVTSPVGVTDALPYSVGVDDDHPFQCGRCDKAFSRSTFACKHELTHDDESRTVQNGDDDDAQQDGGVDGGFAAASVGSRKYNCRYCERVFRHKRSRDRHVKLHAVDRTFSCSVCGAQFARSDHLKTHVSTQHDSPEVASINSANTWTNSSNNNSCKLFTCPDCGVELSSIGTLTAHLFTHAEQQQQQQQRRRNSTTSVTDPNYVRLNDVEMEEENVEEAVKIDECDMSIETLSPYNRRRAGNCGLVNGEGDVDLENVPRLNSRCQAADATTVVSGTASDDELDKDQDQAVRLECPYCQRKDFNSIQPLTSHIRTSHARPSSSNLFTCRVCGLGFATTAKLEEHVETEHRGGQMMMMMMMESSQKLMPTELVDRVGGSPSSADRKSVVRAGSVEIRAGSRGSPGDDGLASMFSCRFCPVVFYDAETQRSHEETIHIRREVAAAMSVDAAGDVAAAAAAASGPPASRASHSPPATVVFCSQCSLGFPHIYALADHMHHSHGYKNHHRGASGAAVDKTGPSTAAATAATPPSPARPSPSAERRGREQPLKPTAVRADSVDPGRSRARQSCGECGAAFETDEELDAHVASAHYLALGTEFGCTSCLKLFARPDDLQKHLMDVHAHHLYRCTLCKQVFDSKVNIQVHFAVKHSNECQVYRCTRCSTVFHSEMEWQLHVRVHHLGMARPYRCLFCRDGFTSEAELSAHVAAHKKPFSCPVCGESFLVEFLLDRHLELHHPCGVDASTQPATNHSGIPPSVLAAAAAGKFGQIPVAALAAAAVHQGVLVGGMVAPVEVIDAKPSMLLVPPSINFSSPSSSGISMSHHSPMSVDVLRRVAAAAAAISSSASPMKRDDPSSAFYSAVVNFTSAAAATIRTSPSSKIQQRGITGLSKSNHADKGGSAMVGSNSGGNSAGQLNGGSGVQPTEKALGHVCVYCAQSFKSKCELERHVKSNHVMPATSQKCNICDEVFPSAAVLAEHKLTHCKVIHGTVCTICKTAMKSEEEFFFHSQQHSSHSAGGATAANQSGGPQAPAASPAANASMPCVVCRQTLVSALELRLHARHHFQTAAAAGSNGCMSSASSSSSFARCRQPFVCCVCLTQFDSPEGVVSRDGGSYFVCLACDRGAGGGGAGIMAAAAAAAAALGDAGSNSSTSQTFQCIKCQESFATEHEVRLHVATHVLQEGNVHECRLCSANGSVCFDSPARLQAHLVADHELPTNASESPVPCGICGRPLGGPAAARAHALEHGPAAWRHACRRCPLRFFFASELRNHELVEGHGLTDSSDRLSIEGRCPSTSPRSANSTSSIQNTVDDLRCPDCSRAFSGYASLCSHRRVHEKLTTPSSSALPIDCSIGATSYQQQQQHLYSIGGVMLSNGNCVGAGNDDGFESSVDSTGGVSGSLMMSKQLQRQTTPLQCPECSRQFPSLSSLQGHMRVHNSGTKYSCGECGKAFSLPQNLAIHVNSHRDDSRPYECRTCHKRFSKKENLKSHARSHSSSGGGKEPSMAGDHVITASEPSHTPDYFSVQCLVGATSPSPPKSSARPGRLHSMSGPKPNEQLCPICGGRFTRTSDLAVHLTKIHGIKAEVVEAEIGPTTALLAGDGSTVMDGLSAAENMMMGNLVETMVVQRLRSNGEMELHSSPALSVQ